MARTHIRVLKSYVFKDKDPAIDGLRTLVEGAHGDVGSKALKAVELNGGPVASTLYNWFHGETKRPQNCTLEAAGRSLGFERRWVKMKKNGSK